MLIDSSQDYYIQFRWIFVLFFIHCGAERWHEPAEGRRPAMQGECHVLKRNVGRLLDAQHKAGVSASSAPHWAVRPPFIMPLFILYASLI
jgi:hypothetical protein